MLLLFVDSTLRRPLYWGLVAFVRVSIVACRRRVAAVVKVRRARITGRLLEASKNIELNICTLHLVRNLVTYLKHRRRFFVVVVLRRIGRSVGPLAPCALEQCHLRPFIGSIVVCRRRRWVRRKLPSRAARFARVMRVMLCVLLRCACLMMLIVACKYRLVRQRGRLQQTSGEHDCLVSERCNGKRRREQEVVLPILAYQNSRRPPPIVFANVRRNDDAPVELIDERTRDPPQFAPRFQLKLGKLIERTRRCVAVPRFRAIEFVYSRCAVLHLSSTPYTQTRPFMQRIRSSLLCLNFCLTLSAHPWPAQRPSSHIDAHFFTAACCDARREHLRRSHERRKQNISGLLR